ncbi:MAG: pyridoxal phosphate-dependent aminotransferase [Rhodobacteraceae bacterium]|nr:pyridoxal phosphate-dependent aminotransferase [Paracoccaceae bacterium]
MVTLTDVVAALPETVPFVGPEAQERQRGRLFKARIGANENVFGPSPGAIRAMQDAVPSAWQYGDPESHDLREALAAHHDIDMNNLVVGEGIDGLLGYLCRLIVQPGTRVVTSAGAYPTFNYHVQASGGELIPVPYVDDHESPEDLVACAKRVGARLVYLANPDNPMGTWSSGATISSALSRLPSDCLLVLDEAYIDCAPRGAAPEIDTADTRLVRMRTFSKAYGMAGMRTGYAIGHTALIAAFNRVRNHFGMCRVSQAGALAALADQAYLAAVVTRIAAARDRITAIAAAAGLSTLPSAANFVAIDCGGDGALAQRVLSELLKRDIFVRMPFVAPQDRCIRISAGTDTLLDLFEAALPEALESAVAHNGKIQPEV